MARTITQQQYLHLQTIVQDSALPLFLNQFDITVRSDDASSSSDVPLSSSACYFLASIFTSFPRDELMDTTLLLKFSFEGLHDLSKLVSKKTSTLNITMNELVANHFIERATDGYYLLRSSNSSDNQFEWFSYLAEINEAFEIFLANVDEAKTIDNKQALIDTFKEGHHEKIKKIKHHLHTFQQLITNVRQSATHDDSNVMQLPTKLQPLWSLSEDHESAIELFYKNEREYRQLAKQAESQEQLPPYSANASSSSAEEKLYDFERISTSALDAEAAKMQELGSLPLQKRKKEEAKLMSAQLKKDMQDESRFLKKHKRKFSTSSQSHSSTLFLPPRSYTPECDTALPSKKSKGSSLAKLIEVGDIASIREAVLSQSVDAVLSRETGDTYLMRAVRMQRADLVEIIAAMLHSVEPKALYQMLIAKNQVLKKNIFVIAAESGQLLSLIEGIQGAIASKSASPYETQVKKALKVTIDKFTLQNTDSAVLTALQAAHDNLDFSRSKSPSPVQKS